MRTKDKFSLKNKVAIITGGAGLLGIKHAQVISEFGGIPILWDLSRASIDKAIKDISSNSKTECFGMEVDITNPENIEEAIKKIEAKYKNIDILINNAANNPSMSKERKELTTRLESFPLDLWEEDLKVGITGAFLCSKFIGRKMAEDNGGVILNISSDLGIIAPDQRIYKKNGLEEKDQPVKPVTYSVVKHAIIGLTKYLSTYWADDNIRINSLSPGGILTDQSEELISNLTNLIPMGRMANEDEYKAAVLFLISDASSYMTGSNLIIDGGRTSW